MAAAEDVEVYLGESQADIAVTINAYPRPNITWFKGQQAISPNDRNYELRYAWHSFSLMAQ